MRKIPKDEPTTKAAQPPAAPPATTRERPLVGYTLGELSQGSRTGSSMDEMLDPFGEDTSTQKRVQAAREARGEKTK
jgi:hypothetical protein